MAIDHEFRRRSSYFDPKPPAPPEDVLGVPSQALLELGRAAGLLAMQAPGYSGAIWGYNAAYRLEPALQLFNLVQRQQLGENLVPKDARPYREPIKKLVPKAGTASALTAVTSGLLVGIPARIMLNRQIEKRTIRRLPEIMAEAEDYVRAAEPAVSFLADFNRPRDEFLYEIGVVAGGIRELAEAKAGRKPVSANNAGWAIGIAAEQLLANRRSGMLPMLSQTTMLGVRWNRLPEPNKIAIVAPEILESLDSVLPEDQKLTDLIDSTYEHPARWRGLAEKTHRRALETLAENGPRLLPAIRDILPETGDEVWDQYERAKKFLAMPLDPEA